MGSGGFASVYEVTKSNQTHKKAVKIISLVGKKDHSENHILFKVNIKLIKMNKEIQILQRACKGCSNIVQYYHNFCQGKEGYIIM